MAGASTALVVLLMRPPGLMVVRWRLGSPPSGRRTLRFSRLPTVGALGAVVLLLLAAGSPSLVIAGSTVVGVGWFWWRLRLAGRESAARRARSAVVAEVVDTLASELGAGILPQQALERLGEEVALLEAAVAASRIGGDVPRALRTSAARPGAEALAEVAAAWEVSERSGAPMSRVLERLGDGIRDEREVQREVLAGLGPAKATARLMAVLPLFGLAMGASMGAHPVTVLLDTVPGALCLASGCALACAGVWWVDRIAARAEVA